MAAQGARRVEDVGLRVREVEGRRRGALGGESRDGAALDELAGEQSSGWPGLQRKAPLDPRFYEAAARALAGSREGDSFVGLQRGCSHGPHYISPPALTALMSQPVNNASDGNSASGALRLQCEGARVALASR